MQQRNADGYWRTSTFALFPPSHSVPCCFSFLLAQLTQTERRSCESSLPTLRSGPTNRAQCKVQYAVGDTACPGLCVRITPKGIKSFAFAYRKPKGKVEWLTIGRYPDVPLTRAREVANDARKTVAGGGTPVLRAETENAKTYAQVVELYHAERLIGLRSGDKVRTILQRIGRIYGWNNRPIAAISDDAAAAILADIANRCGKLAPRS